MTATAVETPPPPAPATMPGVASLAIRAVIDAPPHRACILGASSHAIWLQVDRDVVVVSSRDATRLPNGVEVPLASGELPFRGIREGADAEIGSGRVAFDRLDIDVVRWWDPHPRLATTSCTALAAAVVGLPSRVPGVAYGELQGAIETRSTAHLVAAAGAMLGLGPGLTPEADDYLAGALSAVRCLAPVLGIQRATAMLDAAEAPIVALAAAKTTAFSASLIRHAFEGNVAAPAGALLRSLAGRGEARRAHRHLLNVGHTSGPALAAGMVLGARALIEGDTT